MYLRTRLVQPGMPSWAGEVPDGATLADVLTAAGADVPEGSALSQNGRRASPADPVKPEATVMLSPAAAHG